MFQVSEQRFSLQEITLEQASTLQERIIIGRWTRPEGTVAHGELMLEQVEPEVL